MSKGIIIFDADGTLFNTLPGIYETLKDLYKHFGLGFFDLNDGMKYIGPPIKDSLMRYNGLTEDEAEIATNYYRKVYVEQYITMSNYYEGVDDALTTLKKHGYQVGLATMKTSLQVEKLFDVTGGRKYFDYVETAKEDGTYKKHQMIDCIRDKSKSKIIFMVGDTDHDKLAAEKAGVGFIGASYGYGFKRNEKYSFPCINSLGELFEIVKMKGDLSE